MKIGVLASHEGTTLQAVLDECRDGRLNARVSVVISNNSDAGALRRAYAAGIATLHLSGKTHPDPDALDRAICEGLSAHAADIVLLAGYMKKLGRRARERFAGRIINTHPALLPKFGGQGMYGAHVHRAVLESGETVTGVSVHVVDGEYDAGAVLAQTEVAVEADDTVETLAARVQARERAFLVEVLGEIAAGRIRLGPPGDR
jgi:phosphoribosylglycinamide formyltransferase-1